MIRKQLTKNLWRHEMACKCRKCGLDTMDWETLNVVQECCDHFAEQLGMPRVVCTINSAHRCPEHNNKPQSQGGAGGSPMSQHLFGRAIDFSIRGVAAKDVLKYLLNKYPDKYGIGDYQNQNFVHIDTRTGPMVRW